MRVIVFLLLLSLTGCASTIVGNPCSPHNLESKVCYEVQCDGECKRAVMRFISYSQKCEGYSKVKPKTRMHPNFPGGHAWVEGEYNGKFFELFND